MDYCDYAKVLEDCSFFGRFIENLYVQRNVDASVFFRNNQWRVKEWLFGIDWKKTDEGSNYWKEIWLAWCRFVETNDYAHISKWYGKPLEGPKENETNDEKVNPKFSIEARKKRQGKLNFAL